jgi:SAM-dependent methyltransferase
VRKSANNNPAKPKPHTKRALSARVARRLAPKSPPGTRRAEMFFNDYPDFFQTSRTTPQPDRLNLRYEAIMGENRDILKGARVLDIASHDGRWSFAALKSGAAHVVGIEAKQELVDNAVTTFGKYGVDSATYEFACGDIFEVMAQQTFDVDVVMCLGFLYHTLRYNELLSLIRRLNPRYLIIDTVVTTIGGGPVVKLRAEAADREHNAVPDQHSYGNTVLSGKPNMKALRVMLKAYGFTITNVSDWGSLLRDNPNSEAIATYARGERVTIRCDSD